MMVVVPLFALKVAVVDGNRKWDWGGMLNVEV
jgi:hypothetical protein